MTTAKRCDRCGNPRCNRIYRIPVGTPTKRIFRVCGRCIVREAQATREWLAKMEERLK